jgi:hypothetical protein
MARRTADDFIAEVRDCAGGETDETISDARILRWVNEEYKILCAKYLFPQLVNSETVTTVSGTGTYELAEADILEVHEVTDSTNGVYMRPIDSYLYSRWTASGTTPGNPVRWLVEGVGSNGRFQLKFFPTPDGIYSLTVSYYEFTPLVTTPTATSTVIPQQFDPVIVNRAAAQALRSIGNHDSGYRFLLGAKEMEEQIHKTAVSPTSYTPVHPRSIIGRALNE